MLATSGKGFKVTGSAREMIHLTKSRIQSNVGEQLTVGQAGKGFMMWTKGIRASNLLQRKRRVKDRNTLDRRASAGKARLCKIRTS